jgi:hypothetical protein
MNRLRALVLGVVAAGTLSSAVASAHTVNICWRYEDDGSLTFYAGHYHASANPVGALIIDGATYNFTATTTLPPDDLTCQPESCGASQSPYRWQIVNVSGLALDVCQIDITNTGDECGWPGCYPQMMDLAPPCDDADADGVCDDADNCMLDPNADQADSDGDGDGDGCDGCPLDPENDADVDGACGDVDNCLSVANADQADSDLDGAGDACDACALDPEDDEDADGICGDVDVCSGTVLPESMPAWKLHKNHYADVDGDGVFETKSSWCGGHGPQATFTLEDTAGCTCEQIADELNLGCGHVKHGCSKGVMQYWIWLVNQ